jgi:Zn finger protein HypA/HybF involved in hydrogenase expression
MIAPQPFKLKCLKCNYSKVVAPKSDVVNPFDFISTCPKCHNSMQREELNILDRLKISFRAV